MIGRRGGVRIGVGLAGEAGVRGRGLEGRAWEFQKSSCCTQGRESQRSLYLQTNPDLSFPISTGSSTKVLHIAMAVYTFIIISSLEPKKNCS